MAAPAAQTLSPADPRRIGRFLDELALIGADELGGWTRLAFSPEEREAHELFARWAAELGCAVHTDAVGNTYAELAGTRGGAAFLAGSHLDTVPQGGRFDGAAGVAAALEVAALLAGSERLAAPFRAVAFAGEEGARFGAACIGSRVAVGRLGADDLTTLVDADGRSVWECAAAVGLAPLAAGSAVVPTGFVRAFFELHIEQGRVLETQERRLGLVEAIAGSIRLEVVFTGRADHSGATPMGLRKDALPAASELVLALEAEAARRPPAVATVGRLEVRPGAITTVPGEARLLVDIRDASPDGQRGLAAFARETAHGIADRRGLDASVHVISEQPPTALDARLRDELAGILRAAGIPFGVLPSGASHDAAQIASVAPAAMVFVPSRAGLSHAPGEWSDVEDIARGAEAIAAAIVSLDGGA